MTFYDREVQEKDRNLFQKAVFGVFFQDLTENPSETGFLDIRDESLKWIVYPKFQNCSR